MGRNKQRMGGKAAPRMDSELISLMRLVEAKQFREIVAVARRILLHRPSQPLAKKALSFAMIGLGCFVEVLPVLDSAIGLGVTDPELYNNRGIALSELMRWDESIADFEMSLRLAPNDPEVLKNLGVAYSRMHRWNDAVPPLMKAIEYHPGDYVDAIEVLAGALANGGRLDEAWVCYRELWSSQKEVRFLYELISTSMRRCDWTGVREWITELRLLSNNFAVPVGNPFISLFCPGLESAEQRLVASTHVRDVIPRHFLEDVAAFPKLKSLEGRKLRVGYLSADFRVHPVGFVIPQVIELHDRTSFEIFGYSIGVDDGSAIRQRLVSAFDHFVDMQCSSVTQMVQRIQDDGIDILVDLQGWTSSGRPEVLALRAAPIQVNWLGYAGTMGHEHLADYLIGDAVVTPIDQAGDYTECLALLPGSYLPADTQAKVPPPPSREVEGLPESGFVFCSFNNSYKFNPDLFDVWCDLLQQAENSCLWLSRPSGNASERLKDEVARRGVDPGRIVFASRVDSRLGHLARLQLADLALDTFPYNSHSTGVDILWAGVPMVSCRGSTFPGRVGASLLKNVGLDELVASSTSEYKEIALNLYRDRYRLAGLRQLLVERRGDSNLFSMKRFVTSLERLFVAMWNNATSGERKAVVID